VSRNRGASKGLLRVSAPRALGDADVSPVRHDLVRAYPKISAELIQPIVRGADRRCCSDQHSEALRPGRSQAGRQLSHCRSPRPTISKATARLPFARICGVMNACSTAAPLDAMAAAELGNALPPRSPSSTMRIFSSARVLFAPTPLESDAEAIDQSRSGEGLRQEANCSRLQGSGTGGLVGEGGDEYERHAITLCPHHRQKFQSAHARHL
jgi:hypothetical protein